MSLKLKALGLVETTSETQKKNGTRRFHDPVMGCDYLSYESGYVRRAFPRRKNWFGGWSETIYQLNKTRKAVQVYNGRSYEATVRIMIPTEEARLERLAHSVATYRNNNKKKYIVLHHTAGRHNPFKRIYHWARDQRGRVGTNYVIGGLPTYRNNNK